MHSDEELAVSARAGDDEALHELLHRYRPFARAKARSYYFNGAETDDVVQEGMIGLYKAVRDFDPSLDISFRGFAELCVNRQLISAVKAANRHKHGPLNSYVSLTGPIGADDEGERVLADVLPASPQLDPAEQVTSAERIRALQEFIDRVLSDLEVDVLRMYVEGHSYTEIAEVLQRRTKAVDNALQRVKRKIEGHLHERETAEQG